MALTRQRFSNAGVTRNLAGIGLVLALVVVGAAPSATTLQGHPDTRLLWSASVPNDPDCSARQAPYFKAIGVPSAWEVTTGSEAVVVAVLDSGVDPSHPDLAGRVVAGRNIVKAETTPPTSAVTARTWRASSEP